MVLSRPSNSWDIIWDVQTKHGVVRVEAILHLACVPVVLAIDIDPVALSATPFHKSCYDLASVAWKLDLKAKLSCK